MAVVADNTLAAGGVLEEALASGDECRDDSGDIGSCSLNALQLRAASANRQEAEAQCAPEGQWCGDGYPVRGCCGSSDQCLPSASMYRCQATSSTSQAHCAPTGQWCGSQSVQKACCSSGDECLPDGHIFKCQPSSKAFALSTTPFPSGPCTPLGQWCGAHFPAKQCCGADNDCLQDGNIFKCQPALAFPDPRRASELDLVDGPCMQIGAQCGDKVPDRPCCMSGASCLPVGDVFMCQLAFLPSASLQDSCMPEGSWCGNTYAERTCCGGNCHRSGNIFKCSPRASTTYPVGFKCMPAGQVCGGPAGTPLPCCGISRCEPAGRGLLVCKTPPVDNRCAVKDEICGGLDHDPRSCCDKSLQCQLQPGIEGIFKCVQPCVVKWGQICGGRGHRQCACSTGSCKLVWWNVFSQKERCL